MHAAHVGLHWQTAHPEAHSFSMSFNFDEEVDKWGRSLRTRVHGGPGLTDREYVYTRVTPGEYTIELIAGERTLRRRATILQDHWYDR